MPRASRIVFAAAMLAAPSAARACTIGAVGVNYGAYNPQSAANVDAAGSVSLACPTTVTSPIVALSKGGSGTYSPRRMTNGTFNLNYNLYTAAARTVIWGDGTGGTVTVTLSGGTISGGTRNFNRNIFGRVPGSQNVGAGSYSDTITLTVTF
jgi:spore coat protein U-like protein